MENKEQLLVDDVDETESVVVLFPEGPLAQTAGGVEPGLGDGVFLDFVGHCFDFLLQISGKSCG
jgi:hypothetical protein